MWRIQFLLTTSEQPGKQAYQYFSSSLWNETQLFLNLLWHSNANKTNWWWVRCINIRGAMIRTIVSHGRIYSLPCNRFCTATEQATVSRKQLMQLFNKVVSHTNNKENVLLLFHCIRKSSDGRQRWRGKCSRTRRLIIRPSWDIP